MEISKLYAYQKFQFKGNKTVAFFFFFFFFVFLLFFFPVELDTYFRSG